LPLFQFFDWLDQLEKDQGRSLGWTMATCPRCQLTAWRKNHPVNQGEIVWACRQCAVFQTNDRLEVIVRGLREHPARVGYTEQCPRCGRETDGTLVPGEDVSEGWSFSCLGPHEPAGPSEWFRPSSELPRCE
jgi:hypothetical protein